MPPQPDESAYPDGLYHPAPSLQIKNSANKKSHCAPGVRVGHSATRNPRFCDYSELADAAIWLAVFGSFIIARIAVEISMTTPP